MGSRRVSRVLEGELPDLEAKRRSTIPNDVEYDGLPLPVGGRHWLVVEHHPRSDPDADGHWLEDEHFFFIIHERCRVMFDPTARGPVWADCPVMLELDNVGIDAFGIDASLTSGLSGGRMPVGPGCWEIECWSDYYPGEYGGCGEWDGGLRVVQPPVDPVIGSAVRPEESAHAR